MKVLLTCQSSAYGGVERRLLHEACLLRSLGFEVWLAPAHFPSDDIWLDAMAKYGVRRFRWSPYKFIERQHTFFPAVQSGIIGQYRLRFAKFTLAHVAMPWTRVGLSRVYHLVEAGIPVVLSLHCTYPREHWRPELTDYIKRALRGVSAAYAVSSPVRDSFIANFGEYVDHIHIDIIDNGIDTSKFLPDAASRIGLRMQLGLPTDANLVVFCGRFDEFKNPLLAIEIAGRACAAREGLFFVFLGDGPLKAEMTRLASSIGVTERVRFMGFVPDVPRYLQAADVFLSTSSSSEGFGLAPAEALACGLSTLISDNAPSRYAFGACSESTFVAGSDPKEWGSALVNIIDAIRINGVERRAVARAFALRKLDDRVMDSKLREFYMRRQ